MFYRNGDAAGKLQQVVGETQRLVSKTDEEIGMTFPQPFALVPWGHHVEIITKCKSIDEALLLSGELLKESVVEEFSVSTSFLLQYKS